MSKEWHAIILLPHDVMQTYFGIPPLGLPGHPFNLFGAIPCRGERVGSDLVERRRRRAGPENCVSDPLSGRDGAYGAKPLLARRQ